MRKFNINAGIIYLIIFIVTLIKIIFNLDRYPIFNYFINNIIWIGILYISIKLLKNDNMRIRDKNGKMQTLIIFSILYLIIYFSTGLIFGFEYSPYSRKIFSIIKNILAFIVVIFFEEKVRTILVSYSGNKKRYFILISILFIFVNLNFYSFISIKSFSGIFKFIFGTLLVLVTKEFLLTYLSKKCGFKAVIAYIIPIEIVFLLVPVFPRLDWFLNCVFHLIYYFIIFIVVRREYENKEIRERYKSSGLITYIPFFTVIILFIGFVMGFFKYRPIAIMSNSMYPIFSRGDMVIIKNVNKENLQNLQINDIIEYRLDNHTVVHRIIKIEQSNNKLYFKTKGDNNNAPDTEFVSEEQVTGIVKMVAPKLGYPTVWLSDLFNNSKPEVEMGD